jgi:predicted O-methyltransferase YrrM
MAQVTVPQATGPSPIRDPRVLEVIARMNASRRFPPREAFDGPVGKDPEAFADYGFSIHPDQGDLIYLLCRGLGAKRVVDFATSIGMSAIYFAAAVRDNGGGLVIGSEFVPAKVEVARRNLDDAGLAEYADIRAGDAPQLRVGGYILNDNAEPDFLDYIRDPKNGFISITLPIKRGTELALKVE